MTRRRGATGAARVRPIREPSVRAETGGRAVHDVQAADSDGYFCGDVVPAGIQPTVSGPEPGHSRPQEDADVG